MKFRCLTTSYFYFIFYIFTFPLVIKSENLTEDDHDFVKASLMIVSPGAEPHQVFGHAMIRMECPKLNLDRTFSFENSGTNIVKRFLEGAMGNVTEIITKDYLTQFIEEGREVKSYDLNLSLDEKIHLWEILDSVKLLPDRTFDITDSHCFSVITESIDQAVFPARINWDESPLQSLTYGGLIEKLAEPTSPWNALIIGLPLANYLDRSGTGRKFVNPLSFDSDYKEFEIVSLDGSRRPLVNGEPKIIIKKTNANLDKPNHPTPLQTSLILLAIILIITAIQVWKKWIVIGKVLDGILWVFITASGIIIAIVTYMPGHMGGNWTWLFIILNPIAWIPPLVCLLWPIKASLNGKSIKNAGKIATAEKKKRFMLLWLVYGSILSLYAVAITLFSPSTIWAWRIVALALAIRCFYHYYMNRNSHIAKS